MWGLCGVYVGFRLYVGFRVYVGLRFCLQVVFCHSGVPSVELLLGRVLWARRR